MVQISTNCHATITHPLIDTKIHERMYRNRRHFAKIVTTAAEWYSRRNIDNYCFPLVINGAPPIHTFLNNPEGIGKLETKHATPQNPQSAPSQSWKGKQLIEFTDGYVQLEWDHGRWIVHNWKTIETFPIGRVWIQLEEHLLSALIRPPSRPEGVAPAYLVESNLALKKKQDNYGPQHRTHQNNHM